MLSRKRLRWVYGARITIAMAPHVGAQGRVGLEVPSCAGQGVEALDALRKSSRTASGFGYSSTRYRRQRGTVAAITVHVSLSISPLPVP